MHQHFCGDLKKNIKFDVSSNWTDGSTEQYGLFDGDANVDCGVILNDLTNGKQFQITFEKLDSINTFITEDKYMDNVIVGLKDTYDAAGLSFSASDYYTTTIAGESYTTVQITFDSTAMVQIICVRNYDDHIIFISATAQDSFDANTIINNIRTAK